MTPIAELIGKLERALTRAHEALASELENRGDEFDNDYPVPVAPVLREIDEALALLRSISSQKPGNASG
jgi:hypothetical protein